MFPTSARCGISSEGKERETVQVQRARGKMSAGEGGGRNFSPHLGGRYTSWAAESNMSSERIAVVASRTRAGAPTESRLPLSALSAASLRSFVLQRSQLAAHIQSHRRSWCLRSARSFVRHRKVRASVLVALCPAPASRRGRKHRRRVVVLPFNAVRCPTIGWC